MRFIGGKKLLLEEIEKTMREKAPDAKTVIDLFSGSGTVTKHLVSKGYDVICNDQMYFSYVLTRGAAQIKVRPKFEAFNGEDPIDILNSVNPDEFDKETCFIYRNYSPSEGCGRRYFTCENALKIDAVRQTIEKWKTTGKINEDEYFYLLAALISAVPSISNIAGVYGAFLKKWDKRALNDLVIENPILYAEGGRAESFCMKGNDLLKSVRADALYSDSPYNGREYLPNYHVLETIARYDYPEIKGVTGMRDYSSQKSDFCSKTKAPRAFENMIRRADVKHVFISYNNEGIVSTEELSRICRKYAEEGSFELREFPYRRYKSRIPNDEEGLMEQIYSFRKKSNPYDKSPMNYIGGKYRLLPKLMRLFPDDAETAVDLFCGGCDVAANMLYGKIIANDVNGPMIEMYKKFQKNGADSVIAEIEEIIRFYGLSKTNRAGYIALRNDYNSSKDRNPTELFALICFSFNHQIRFNSRLEYNNTFGKERSSFNDSIRANLRKFCENIAEIRFTSVNFKDFGLDVLKKGDFIYADPPYLITTGSYNDGKRGFDGWGEKDDSALFEMLDEANERGIRFAMSNTLSHDGRTNEKLAEWARKYAVTHLSADYSNSSYHKKNRTSKTDEVLITNY